MSRICWAIAPIMFVSAAADLCADREIAITASEGVLVLRNGYVLHGRITPQGDDFLVTMGDDNEARLPAQDVDFVCESLDAAYLMKRDRLNRADVREHLQLATWCLRYGLYGRASDQVLAASLVDPAHPQLRILERRLEANEAEPAAPQSPSAAPNEAPPQGDLTSAAIEQFTQAVQPVLMNRCATNACHGSTAKSEFRLLRPRVGGLMTQRMTQRNLYSTLRYVDQANPEQSQLLTAPTSPHGTMTAPVFDETDFEQLTALIDWVRHVSRRPNRSNKPARLDRPGELLMQTDARQQPWRDEPDALDELWAAGGNRRHTHRARSQLKRNKDPFDPTPFNETYHPQTPSDGLSKENGDPNPRPE